MKQSGTEEIAYFLSTYLTPQSRQIQLLCSHVSFFCTAFLFSYFIPKLPNIEEESLIIRWFCYFAGIQNSFTVSLMLFITLGTYILNDLFIGTLISLLLISGFYSSMLHVIQTGIIYLFHLVHDILSMMEFNLFPGNETLNIQISTYQHKHHPYLIIIILLLSQFLSFTILKGKKRSKYHGIVDYLIRCILMRPFYLTLTYFFDVFGYWGEHRKEIKRLVDGEGKE